VANVIHLKITVFYGKGVKIHILGAIYVLLIRNI